jgi:hypothetical protein
MSFMWPITVQANNCAVSYPQKFSGVEPKAIKGPTKNLSENCAVSMEKEWSNHCQS